MPREGAACQSRLRRERPDQRWELPPGSGAGNGEEDCWAGAAACGSASGGGAVTLRRRVDLAASAPAAPRRSNPLPRPAPRRPAAGPAARWRPRAYCGSWIWRRATASVLRPAAALRLPAPARHWRRDTDVSARPAPDPARPPGTPSCVRRAAASWCRGSPADRSDPSPRCCRSRPRRCPARSAQRRKSDGACGASGLTQLRSEVLRRSSRLEQLISF